MCLLCPSCRFQTALVVFYFFPVSSHVLYHLLLLLIGLQIQYIYIIFHPLILKKFHPFHLADMLVLHLLKYLFVFLIFCLQFLNLLFALYFQIFIETRPISWETPGIVRTHLAEDTREFRDPCICVAQLKLSYSCFILAFVLLLCCWILVNYMLC